MWTTEFIEPIDFAGENLEIVKYVGMQLLLPMFKLVGKIQRMWLRQVSTSYFLGLLLKVEMIKYQYQLET